jgi:hypothetical protein
MPLFQTDTEPFKGIALAFLQPSEDIALALVQLNNHLFLNSSSNFSNVSHAEAYLDLDATLEKALSSINRFSMEFAASRMKTSIPNAINNPSIVLATSSLTIYFHLKCNHNTFQVSQTQPFSGSAMVYAAYDVPSGIVEELWERISDIIP